MRTTVEGTVQPCPQCGTEVRVDTRFGTWCAACDWNVDPGEPEEEPGRLEKLRRELAHRHGEKLLAEVSAGQSLRPRRDAAGVAAYVVALAVHGITAALVVGGCLLVVAAWGAPGMFLGLLLVAFAFVLRPRFGRLPDDVPVLHRTDAPALFSLIDEVAAVADTRSVDAVAIDAQVNMSVRPYGVRSRRLLTIGLPFWEILTPQERIAVLGHELGHYSNGDTRHGLIIGNALRSLFTWCYIMARIPAPNIVGVFVNLLYLVPRSLFLGVLMLLERLTLRATQRAEYLADEVAARAGSTKAAVGLMDRLLVGGSAATWLQREANKQQAFRSRREVTPGAEEPWQGLWERLAADMESIPESEYERQRRAGARRGHCVDSTHPPTHLRRECLLARTPVDAAVVTDGDSERRIDAELADARMVLARRVVRDGLGG